MLAKALDFTQDGCKSCSYSQIQKLWQEQKNVVQAFGNDRTIYFCWFCYVALNTAHTVQRNALRTEKDCNLKFNKH